MDAPKLHTWHLKYFLVVARQWSVKGYNYYLSALTGSSRVLRQIAGGGATSGPINTVLRLGSVQQDFKGGYGMQLSSFLVHFAWIRKKVKIVCTFVTKVVFVANEKSRRSQDTDTIAENVGFIPKKAAFFFQVSKNLMRIHKFFYQLIFLVINQFHPKITFIIIMNHISIV